MKNTTILVFGVLSLALSGCTGSFDKVRNVMGEAPDWYETRKEAASDEGFPSLARVPELGEKTERPGATLAASATEIRNAKQMFASDPRAKLPELSPADIEAQAAAIRREVMANETPTEFLTEAEIEAIRAKFNIGRAKIRF